MSLCDTEFITAGSSPTPTLRRGSGSLHYINNGFSTIQPNSFDNAAHVSGVHYRRKLAPQYYLHTLLLENQKIFHYLSPQNNEKQITEDYQIEYDLVKTNPPLIYLACIPVMQTQDIDKVIKNEYYYYPCFDIHYGHHPIDENNDKMDVSDDFEIEIQIGRAHV